MIVTGNLTFQIDLPCNPADDGMKYGESFDDSLKEQGAVVEARQMSRFVETDLFHLCVIDGLEQMGRD
jgi:hypothetical protein